MGAREEEQPIYVLMEELVAREVRGGLWQSPAPKLSIPGLLQQKTILLQQVAFFVLKESRVL